MAVDSNIAVSELELGQREVERRAMRYADPSKGDRDERYRARRHRSRRYLDESSARVKGAVDFAFLVITDGRTFRRASSARTIGLADLTPR